jgi:hypothetical protein
VSPATLRAGRFGWKGQPTVPSRSPICLSAGRILCDHTLKPLSGERAGSAESSGLFFFLPAREGLGAARIIRFIKNDKWRIIYVRIDGSCVAFRKEADMRGQLIGLSLGVILTLLLNTVLLADAPDTVWTRTYGGPGWDDANSVLRASDGNYVVVGVTSSEGEGLDDLYLLKTDPDGNMIWSKTYGGISWDWGESVAEAPGGYLIAGGTYSFGEGSSDVYLIRTDTDGDSVWARTYGGASFDAGYSVQPTSDGGFIIAGLTESFGAGESDVYLIKIDADGDSIWTRTYGGAGGDVAYSMDVASDGGFIVAGTSSSFGTGSDDVYLLRTDSEGDSLWIRVYGGSASKDYAYSVQEVSGGGFIAVGGTCPLAEGGKDVYIVRTDADGDSLWTEIYGGPDSEVGYAVRETEGDEFVIAGWALTPVVETSDVYLLKIDADGIVLWTTTFGDSGYDWAHGIEITPEHGYLIAGGTDSFGAGDMDVYLIKTGPNPGDPAGIDGPIDDIACGAELGFPWPNPFSVSTRFAFSIGGAGAVEVRVIDVTGRVVRDLYRGRDTTGPGFLEWNGLDDNGRVAAPGVYFIRLEHRGEALSRRLVLVR